MNTKIQTSDGDTYILCRDHFLATGKGYTLKGVSGQQCDGCRHDSGEDIWGQGSAYDAE